MKPFVDAGQLSMNWALISLNIQPSSRTQGLAIRDGKTPKGFGLPQNPAGALTYNETFFLFTMNTELGGIPGTSDPSSAAIALQNRSQQFFVTQLQTGIPFIIYLNTQGLATIQIGVPTDFTAFFNNILVQ
jgi:hypothetical protein